MSLPVKHTRQTIGEAKVLHEKIGGILLVDKDSYSVCSCLPIRWNKCECRTPKHIAGLAPSWDETHPDNAAITCNNHDQQIELF